MSLVERPGDGGFLIIATCVGDNTADFTGCCHWPVKMSRTPTAAKMRSIQGELLISVAATAPCAPDWVAPPGVPKKPFNKVVSNTAEFAELPPTLF